MLEQGETCGILFGVMKIVEHGLGHKPSRLRGSSWGFLFGIMKMVNNGVRRNPV